MISVFEHNVMFILVILWPASELFHLQLCVIVLKEGEKPIVITGLKPSKTLYRNYKKTVTLLALLMMTKEMEQLTSKPQCVG